MLVVVAAALLLQSFQADSAALRHAGGRVAPTMIAVRVSHPPDLDGRLDDPAWAQAVPVRGFRETDPIEGSFPAESTIVMVVYDNDAIYVGARLYDAPAEISSRLGRRDDDTQSDMFYADFDSYHDHRTAFEFAVNPAGVKLDDLCSNDFAIGDRSWDPVWEVATAVDSLGWVVEMRIPFSQLRFPQAHDQLWGVNFFRWVFRKNQFSQWSFKAKTETGYASRFGHLVGLRDIPAPKRLEVRPYSLGRGTYDSPSPTNPFDNGHSYFGSAGLDVKYGVTSNLTLDAAVNPDFGQVESDPAFVNLTAFEQVLQERRPFFVEGASIFTFGGTGPFIGFGNTPQYFYSRRIGRSPTLEPQAPSGGFLDLPTTTTIYGATKLTGKTPGGWSVGVLDAVTAREQASFDSSTGARSRQDVEPAANYLVARVQHEAGGHTQFGFLATAVNRRPHSPAVDSLRGGAYLGAADFYHRWDNNAYSVFGSVGVSHVTGDTLALQVTQRQANHYFQRPDATYLHYDPHRTSLNGASADFALNKEGGNFNWALGLSGSTPGFEVNDLGFQRRADRVAGDLFLQYRWTKPGTLFRSASIGVDPAALAWNDGGDPIQRQSDLNLAGQLLNYWSGNLFLLHQQQTVDDRQITRGGPLSLIPAGWLVQGIIASDQRQAVNGNVNVTYFRDVSHTWTLTLTPLINLRPSSAVSVALGPSYTVGWTAAQPVTSQSDSTATATYGGRYIVGELDQRQLNTTLRLNVTFTPTLSFQLYAQPFTFAGRYTNFKELKAPRTFTFNVYGRDNGSSISYDPGTAVYTVHPTATAPPIQFSNPDSRIRSLRSNAVVRWEYRPGSALFVVWTQSRFVNLADPTLDIGRYLGREMFLDPPTNIVLVKLNYWLTL